VGGSHQGAFSILERIDVGETFDDNGEESDGPSLSVSSNGSTWVKRRLFAWKMRNGRTFSILERIDVGETTCRRRRNIFGPLVFQYPRTDRRG